MSVRFTSPPDLQLLEQQSGHDGLPRARIVGEQEADAGQPHEVVVDGLELVRQRIDPGDREREVQVVLVGEREPCSLDAEAEPRRVAVEGGRSGVASRSLICCGCRTR
jgi:hypothetical protein